MEKIYWEEIYIMNVFGILKEEFDKTIKTSNYVPKTDIYKFTRREELLRILRKSNHKEVKFIFFPQDNEIYFWDNELALHSHVIPFFEKDNPIFGYFQLKKQNMIDKGNKINIDSRLASLQTKNKIKEIINEEWYNTLQLGYKKTQLFRFTTKFELFKLIKKNENKELSFLFDEDKNEIYFWDNDDGRLTHVLIADRFFNKPKFLFQSGYFLYHKNKIRIDSAIPDEIENKIKQKIGGLNEETINEKEINESWFKTFSFGELKVPLELFKFDSKEELFKTLKKHNKYKEVKFLYNEKTNELYYYTNYNIIHNLVIMKAFGRNKIEDFLIGYFILENNKIRVSVRLRKHNNENSIEKIENKIKNLNEEYFNSIKITKAFGPEKIIANIYEYTSENELRKMIKKNTFNSVRFIFNYKTKKLYFWSENQAFHGVVMKELFGKEKINDFIRGEVGIKNVENLPLFLSMDFDESLNITKKEIKESLIELLGKNIEVNLRLFFRRTKRQFNKK